MSAPNYEDRGFCGFCGPKGEAAAAAWAVAGLPRAVAVVAPLLRGVVAVGREQWLARYSSHMGSHVAGSLAT